MLIELVQVLNWMLWISGIILWILIPVFLVLDHMGDKIRQVTTRSIDDDGYLGSRVSYDDLSCKTTAELLDKTLEPNARLNAIYLQLCERAHVQPNSFCDMADLISEAVYDGRHHSRCIYEVDLAASMPVLFPTSERPQSA